MMGAQANQSSADVPENVRPAPSPKPIARRAGYDFPCAIWPGPKGDCNERNCRCY